LFVLTAGDAMAEGSGCWEATRQGIRACSRKGPHGEEVLDRQL